MSPIVKAVDVRKSYERGANRLQVLNGLTFDVREGEFISLVGRSGSGKSTLLNLLGGLDTLTGGEILIGDERLSSMSRRRLAEHRRTTIGMIFQSFNLLPTRSASENVSIPMAFAGRRRRERTRRAARLLAMVGLGERLDHRPDELSGGEAQRVAIARALANDPDLLLADEPTGNLDSTTGDEILDLLVRVNREQGRTVLMVTHDEPTAARISDRIMRLHDGRLTEEMRASRR